MMSFILPRYNQVSAYPQSEPVPDDSRVIKLDQNESAYPPSPQVLQVFADFREEWARRYPDPTAQQLRSRLAELHGLKPEQIVCGNGTSELISLLFRACIGTATVAVAEPSFALYPLAAELSGARVVTIPLSDDVSLNMEAMAEARADVVVVVNPNAPTGKLTPRKHIEWLASTFKGLIIVDEAYMEYVEDETESMLPLLETYTNVVVLRTFSKAYALSGARVGSMFASPAIIEGIGKVKDVYNLNGLSQRLALAALEDQKYMQENVQKTRNTRNLFSDSLEQLGFQVIPSHANFVLCEPPAHHAWPEARQLQQRLQERKIFVRHFSTPALQSKLRISIGTDEQMTYVLDQISSSH